MTSAVGLEEAVGTTGAAVSAGAGLEVAAIAVDAGMAAAGEVAANNWAIVDRAVGLAATGTGPDGLQAASSRPPAMAPRLVAIIRRNSFRESLAGLDKGLPLLLNFGIKCHGNSIIN